MENKQPIRRVLMLCDFACATGFANVAQNVVRQLLLDKENTYQIDIVAINYYGVPNEWQNIAPTVRLFPASFVSGGDVFGRKGYLNLLSSGAYDLTWILQDTFNIEVIGDKIIEIRNMLAEAGQKTFKWIFYYPIDAKPKENWLTKTALLADYPVVYTQYGYDESVRLVPALRDKLIVIPHGVDTQIFHPVDQKEREEFRKRYFDGFADNKFLITNLNRNQPRKDIARTMKVFSDFKKQVPNALLYLHMKNTDVAYTIDEVGREFELIPEQDYITPKDFNEHDGFPPEIINLIYNASDCVMTTTLGEGWGLSMTEAMAAKVPVIAPNHTALIELLADNRGILVEAGKTSSEWIMLQMDNERARPLANIPDFVEKLKVLKNNKEETAQRVENAYEYVTKQWNWDAVGQMWRDLFVKTKIVEKKIKIGRNDLCFCGSGKKYKNCHIAANG
jgi:glycosyltransferase involved in cell wall biosynthesis